MDLIKLKSLEDCPQINLYGEEMVDLLLPVLTDGTSIGKDNTDLVYVIGENLVARPTQLANFAYEDEGMIDFIAHYNGYSNPFAMSSGDVIIIPVQDKMIRIATKTNVTNKTNIAKDLINRKASKTDPNRLSIETPNMNSEMKQTFEMGKTVRLGVNHGSNTGDANSPILGKFAPIIAPKVTDNLVDYAKDYGVKFS